MSDTEHLTSEARRRMLITYAIVSREMIGSNDIFSGLLSFFEPILLKSNGKIFDKQIFIRDVAVSMRWTITVDVADQIVGRMIKKKWLTRELPESDQIYRVTLPDLSRSNDESYPSNLEEISEAFDYFLDTLPKRPVSLTKSESRKEILLEWLVESFSQSPALTSRHDDDHLASGEIIDPKEDPLGKVERHVCARFALWLSETNAKLAQYLAEIGGAVILTEVILHFRNPAMRQRKPSQLTVFVDAPLLMDYLGLSGPILKASATHIIDKFRGLGATVGCFAHSRDEIYSILTALLGSDEAGRYGPTAEALRRKDITEIEVQATFAGLDQKIRNVGVQLVTTTPGQMSSTKTYFPDELIDEVTQRLGQSHLYARERDARSVAVVMRKRQGHRTSDIFDCRVLLLSQSRALVIVGNSVCASHDLLSAHDIGPVIHRSQAAGALFLLMGSDEREKVSRTELLGTCMNIVRLRPRIVADLKAQLNKANASLSEDQLDALLTDPRCATALMDSTVGAGRIIDRNNVEEIVKSIRLSLLDAEQKKHIDKLIRVKREGKEGVKVLTSEFERQISELERRRGTGEQKAIALKADLENAERSRKRVLMALFLECKKSRNVFFVVAKATLVILMVLLVVGSVKLAGSHWEPIYQILLAIGTLGIEIAGIFHFNVVKTIDNIIVSRTRRSFETRVSALALDDVRKYYNVDFQEGTCEEIAIR